MGAKSFENMTQRFHLFAGLPKLEYLVCLECVKCGDRDTFLSDSCIW